MKEHYLRAAGILATGSLLLMFYGQIDSKRTASAAPTNEPSLKKSKTPEHSPPHITAPGST